MEGTTFAFEGRYQDIVPDERIVYSYEVLIDEAGSRSRWRRSAPPRRRHEARLTEQGVFLDGLNDPSQRENSTESLLDALGKELER